MREVIVLTAHPGEAVRSARERIEHVLRSSPREGCGGFSGVALDRILHWEVGRSGGVALTLPSFRVPESRPVFFGRSSKGRP